MISDMNVTFLECHTLTTRNLNVPYILTTISDWSTENNIIHTTITNNTKYGILYLDFHDENSSIDNVQITINFDFEDNPNILPIVNFIAIGETSQSNASVYNPSAEEHNSVVICLQPIQTTSTIKGHLVYQLIDF